MADSGRREEGVLWVRGGSGGVGCCGPVRLLRCLRAPGRAWLGWAELGGLVSEMRVMPRCHRCLWWGGPVVGDLPKRAGGVLGGLWT